jgi:AraC-like DNA-binding protein
VSYHFAKPSVILSQYVKHYWAIEDCVPNESEHIQRIVPSGLMELMFFLCEKPKSLDVKKSISENTILSGQQKGYYDIAVSGKLSLFSISFQPYGAKLFFGIPSNEFFDQNIPLKYLVKDIVEKLEFQLYEADTFEKKICLAENFLINRLQNSSKQYNINRIIKSVALINQTHGLIDIDSLSSFACLSRKQYERIFAEYIGSTPKQFLRTVRFQSTLHKKDKNKGIHLTELAYNCGYYDQSHMINDYKLLTGITPSQYFSECEPHSDYFQ